MELIKDSNNLYLKKFFDKPVIDRMDTLWLFYERDQEIPKIKLNEGENLFCGKFAFENHQKLQPFNDWKRSGIDKNLKPNIIKKIDLIAQDQRKVYYDFLKLHSSYSYDFPISFIAKEDYTDWLNSTFLSNYDTRHISYFLKVLGKIETIILKGYHHNGKNIILFISKKGKQIFDKNLIETDENFEIIFENTCIYSCFHQK